MVENAQALPFGIYLIQREEVILDWRAFASFPWCSIERIIWLLIQKTNLHQFTTNVRLLASRETGNSTLLTKIDKQYGARSVMQPYNTFSSTVGGRRYRFLRMLSHNPSIMEACACLIAEKSSSKTHHMQYNQTHENVDEKTLKITFRCQNSTSSNGANSSQIRTLRLC